MYKTRNPHTIQLNIKTEKSFNYNQKENSHCDELKMENLDIGSRRGQSYTLNDILSKTGVVCKR